MMDPLLSETRWSNFKYFKNLIVSTNYILCISWIIIKCLIRKVFYLESIIILYSNRQLQSEISTGNEPRTVHHTIMYFLQDISEFLIKKCLISGNSFLRNILAKNDCI